MDDPTEVDDSESHPEVTALLRGEAVALDPIRRDSAIDAALELSSTLFPVDATEGGHVSGGADSTHSTRGTDELAARRAPTPVPTPRHASGRRGLLVAAAVVVLAGIGVAGLAAGRGDSEDLSSGASNDGAATQLADGQASETPPDVVSGGTTDAEGGSARDGSAEAGGAAQAPSAGTSADDRSAAESFEGAAPTTTVALTPGASRGAFASVEDLLDALHADAGYRSADQLDELGVAASGCGGELTRLGLVATATASVGSRPVWLASPVGEPAVLVVVDATSCAELGRR